MYIYDTSWGDIDFKYIYKEDIIIKENQLELWANRMN